MKVTSAQINDITVLRLSGKLTIGNESTLQDVIKTHLAAGHKNLIVNLEDVSYIDSVGIGQLVASYKKIAEKGGSLRLVVSPGKVRKSFELTKLDQYFKISPTEREAMT